MTDDVTPSQLEDCSAAAAGKSREVDPGACPHCGQSMPLRGFSVGEKVRHFDSHVGEVVFISAGSITVRFPGKRGSWQGVYDRLWFSLYPDGLLKVLDEPRGLSAVTEKTNE